MVGSMTVPKAAAAASLVAVVICALLGLSRLETAQGAIPEHLVSKLPGQPAVNFTQFAGYINVDEANGRNIFYWFTEADSKKASSLPLAFWFNGGQIYCKTPNSTLHFLSNFILTFSLLFFFGAAFLLLEKKNYCIKNFHIRANSSKKYSQSLLHILSGMVK